LRKKGGGPIDKGGVSGGVSRKPSKRKTLKPKEETGGGCMAKLTPREGVEKKGRLSRDWRGGKLFILHTGEKGGSLMEIGSERLQIEKDNAERKSKGRPS